MAEQETKKGVLGGLFDAKVFDIFRGDQGDANAAARRGARQASKAAANKARAETLVEELGIGVSGGDAVAQGRADNRGGVAVNVADAPIIRRLRSQTRALAQALAESAATQEEQQEQITELVENQQRLVQGVMKMRDVLKEKFKKDESNMGMLSDGVLSAANGIISVINVSDAVQYPLFKVAEVGITGVIASDYVEGNTEKWLRLIALLCNTAAYYDGTVGVTSLFTTDTGGLIPEAATSGVTGGADLSAYPRLNALFAA